MLLRYLPLFLGLVFLINGCNGLVSQNFGTHKLRTFDYDDAVAGVGDADFVAVAGAMYLDSAGIVGLPLKEGDTYYFLRPVLPEAEVARWRKGETVTAHLVTWAEMETNDFPADPPIRGLVSEPAREKNPVESWLGQRVQLAERVTYIQLGEGPTAWYWNLGMLLGGLVLVVGNEWVARRRTSRSTV